MINEFSIVIPALNEEHYLPKLLNSIVLQDFKGKLEVIVVDGNSKDRTVEVAKSFKQKISDLTILTLRKRGISYQRNRGAEKAKYKYLLFLDADMILPKHFLNRFLKKVNTQENFVEIATIWVAERDILSYLVFIIMYIPVIAILLIEKGTPGFLLLTTKKNHMKIQGFREDLKIGEDIDYGRRSIAHGAKYHLHFYPFVLFSVRRLQKMGRLKFYYDYLRGYRAVKRHGIEAAEQAIDYPFGHFQKS